MTIRDEFVVRLHLDPLLVPPELEIDFVKPNRIEVIRQVSCQVGIWRVVNKMLGRSYRTRRENRSGSNSSAIINSYKRKVGRK